MLEAWRVSDKTQSHRAQVFYDSLTGKKDTVAFLNTIASLHQYLERHPDTRLKVRTMMYEVLGTWLFKLDPKKCLNLSFEAIKTAYPLKDEQLNAELYALYADNCEDVYDFYLYNIKALDLQRKIGYKYFNFVHNRLYGISYACYVTGDYKRCISFGREYLAYKVDAKYRNPMVYILQLDFLGAAYKKLADYDSCYYFYNELLTSIPTMIVGENLQKQNIWTGIAKGNMGYSLAMKKRSKEAIPLLQEYLQRSVAAHDSLNISIAQNNLAAFYSGEKKYADALNASLEALRIGKTQANAMQHVNEALKSIANLYTLTGNTDSAFHYYKLYVNYNNTLQDSLRRFEYANISSQLKFDNLQNSLQATEFALDRLRNIRNFVIAITTLVAIIIVLLYNRKRIRNKHTMELLQNKQEAAQKEIKQAQSQLLAFTKNIQEKNSMIEALLQQACAQDDEVSRKLAQYTLMTNEQWEKFRLEFDKAYPVFFRQINSRMSHSTPALQRLAALIFLKLNNSEIAGALGIGKESVSRNKRRLRENLGLSEGQVLEEYIASLPTTEQK